MTMNLPPLKLNSGPTGVMQSVAMKTTLPPIMLLVPWPLIVPPKFDRQPADGPTASTSTPSTSSGSVTQLPADAVAEAASKRVTAAGRAIVRRKEVNIMCVSGIKLNLIISTLQIKPRTAQPFMWFSRYMFIRQH